MKLNNEFIIIPGAKKSGTTTLHKLLTEHSRISKTRIKEPRFFLLEQEDIFKNIKWYKKNFINKNKILIDATPNYLYKKEIPEKIKKTLKKEPRIIIILRDPAKRVYSEYYFCFNKVNKLDLRSFKTVLNQIKGPDFNKIIKSEEESVQKVIKRNEKSIKKYIKNAKKWRKDYMNEYSDKLHALNFTKYYTNHYDYVIRHKLSYFTNSLYSEHVTLWIKNFKNVKIIFFEELLTKPEEVIKDVLKFLKLKPEKEVLKLPHSNKTIVPTSKGRVIKRMASKYIPIKIIKFLKKLIPESLMYKPKPKMTKEEYKKARKILKKEYEYWYKKHPKLKKYWKY